jgi:hypothetical protein
MNFKNLKILSLCLFPLLFLSCNNDDESSNATEDEAFFRLEVGNYWVYHYYKKQNTDDFVFGNRVDTVKITGITQMDNQDYFVMESKGYQFSSGEIMESKIENVRINSSGHLVKDNGIVLHPGEDMSYTHQVTYNQYQPPFVIEYRLHPVENWTFNGQNYQLAPYRGMARAEDILNHPYLDGKKVEYSYQKGIGKVLEHISAVENPFFFEYRLVDYHLN